MIFKRSQQRTAGFTLVELLIVIGIVVILAAATILALNPAELLRQSRDSTRLQEVAVLNKGFALFEFEGSPGGLGNPSSTYFSVHDTGATTTAMTNCAGAGLSAPVGRLYRCAASSTVNLVNGTGWMPVNFGAISAGAPFSRLPRDPVNSVANEQYFTYVPGSGSTWAFTAFMESAKYLGMAKNDGGYNPSRYEVGKDLSLVGVSEGLIGWWPLDDGSGLSAGDRSKNVNNGALTNGPTWVAGKWNQALSFDGVNDRVDMASTAVLNGAYPFTVAAWFKTSVSTGYRSIVNKYVSDAFNGYNLFVTDGKLCAQYFRDNLNNVYDGNDCTLSVAGYNDNGWHYVIYTVDSTGGKIYVDGSQKNNWGWTGTPGSVTTPEQLHIGYYPGGDYFAGLIDEVRIYARAVTAGEASALYNALR